MSMPYNTTELILATGGIIASAAYLAAVVVLIADEVIEESAALAKMVSGVDLTSGKRSQKSEPRDRTGRVAAMTSTDGSPS